MLKLSLVKNGLGFIRNKRFPNVCRNAHVIAVGGQSCYEHFDSSFNLKIWIRNSNQEIEQVKTEELHISKDLY